MAATPHAIHHPTQRARRAPLTAAPLQNPRQASSPYRACRGSPFQTPPIRLSPRRSLPATSPG